MLYVITDFSFSIREITKSILFVLITSLINAFQERSIDIYEDQEETTQLDVGLRK